MADYYWLRAINKFHDTDYDSNYIHMCKAGINSIPMNHGVNIHRNNPAVIDECFKLSSYIAKVNTKDSIPKFINMFGKSQLPSK
jgi:hypothetical protein